MSNAASIYDTVRKGGTKTNLGRVTGWDGVAVQQADIASAEYSVYLLDADDPDARTVVSGHDGVALTVADIIHDALQTGAVWTKDATGYNFQHTVPVKNYPAFTTAGRSYLVEYTLTPVGCGSSSSSSSSGIPAAEDPDTQPIVLGFILACIQ